MIRSITFAVFLIVLLVPSWGHAVLTQGTIGVTMHIDPDDAPVSGKPSRFYFWFKDTTGRLNSAQCQGVFSIELDHSLLVSEPLFDPKHPGLISAHDVTFPKPGVYSVQVNGRPTGTGGFQPFFMQFSVRVEPGEGGQEDAANSPTNWILDHALVLGGGVLAAGLIVWLGIRPRSRKKRP